MFYNWSVMKKNATLEILSIIRNFAFSKCNSLIQQ